jgi:hypothetical protein
MHRPLPGPGDEAAQQPPFGRPSRQLGKEHWVPRMSPDRLRPAVDGGASGARRPGRRRERRSVPAVGSA